MPAIFEPKDLSVIVKHGVRTAALANPAMLGTDALQVERIDLEAEGTTSRFQAADSERFIYVIRGSGQAHVAQEILPLQAESVLWLEKEDSFHLQADAGGLEVLLCHAPARE